MIRVHIALIIHGFNGLGGYSHDWNFSELDFPGVEIPYPINNYCNYEVTSWGFKG